jgi:hypothetical protein
MTRLQFRTLYREFLFRVVDLELLSSHAQGDASKILGQFASLLILISCLLSLAILNIGDARIPPAAVSIVFWGMEHFLIATTMLVVGLFAVLSWDSTFPDRRDVLVLSPLPLNTGAIFLAKGAALASVLTLAVVVLNALPAAAWTIATSTGDGILGSVLSLALYRSFVAYSITLISAGVFIFGAMLCVQGIAAQLLPRRLFLRVSALLQMAALCLLVTVYFLQPSLAAPEALVDPGNLALLRLLPSYWFLGLLHQLSGSMHPALEPLARSAWIGLAAVSLGAASTFMLSYVRAVRKIVEEPDIAPGSRSGGWLPDFGAAIETAITQFSLRTLVRSRLHRLILAFYLGIGFAITILFLKTPGAQRQFASVSYVDTLHALSTQLMAASIVVVCAWVVGTRVVFSMPLDLPANWIFRITPIGGAPACFTARRRALLVLALAPAIALSAVVFLTIWPWEQAVRHIVVLLLLGIALVELSLYGTQKIPFTCSYLPGRSHFHLTFWLCIGLLMLLISKGAQFERKALSDPNLYWGIVVTLVAIATFARLGHRWRSPDVQFDDDPLPAIIGLELNH